VAEDLAIALRLSVRAFSPNSDEELQAAETESEQGFREFCDSLVEAARVCES
jgi:hypothetical protein